MTRELPGAVTTRCPECGEEGVHAVLHGHVSQRGSVLTVDATVRCESCSHTHHAIVREARDVEVPVIVSAGGQSVRTRIQLPASDPIRIDDSLIVDGTDCKVSGLETKDGKRVDAATVGEVKTIWTKRFDVVEVGFAINLDKKTITKTLPVEPSREFTVGEEFVFGRLRVTVHAIKTEERLIKRGSAEAGDIRRIFARPTPLARPEHRPDKRTREQLREKEERKARRDGRRSA